MTTELLTEYLVDDMTVNVGQATVDPVLSHTQSQVIDPQQMQDRRMQVIAPSLVLNGLISPIVTPTIRYPRLDPRTP